MKKTRKANKATRFLSSVMAIVMTLSLCIETCSADAVDISAYLKGTDITGNAYKWTAARYKELQNIDTAETKALKEASDKDYSTDTGWFRFTMIRNETMKNSSTDEYIALKGKVSGNSYTQNVSYFTHPLGKALRYAWLSNQDSTDSQKQLTYSMPMDSGVLGYNYVVPEAIISMEDISGTALTSLVADQSCYTDLGTTTTGETYDSWWIKYAGESPTQNLPMYYIAAEGKDGQRYLLVYISDVYIKQEDNGNKVCEEQRAVLVTAEEYKAHPELYQTRYAWPTILTDNDLSYNAENAHKYRGILNDSSKKLEVSSSGVYTECFSVGVENSCCWIPKGDNSAYSYFSSAATYETFDKNSSSLYQYIIKNGTALTKYFADEVITMLQRNTIYGNSYIDKNDKNKTKYGTNACFGLTYVWSSQEKKNIYYCCLTTADKTAPVVPVIATEPAISKEYHVKEGEILTLSSQVTLPEGTKLIVDKGGTLKVTGRLQMTNAELIIKGTLIVENKAWIKSFYGGAYMTVDGGTLVICHDGAIRTWGCDPSYLRVQNGGTVQNSGLIQIGTGQISLSNCFFDNLLTGVVVNGAFTTGYDNDETFMTVTEYMRTASKFSDVFCNDDNGPRMEFTGWKTTWNYNQSGYASNNILVLNENVVYRNNGRTFAFGAMNASSNNNYIIGSQEIMECPDWLCAYTSAKLSDFKSAINGTFSFVNDDNYTQVIGEYGKDSYIYNATLGWGETSCVVAYGYQSITDDVLKMANLTISQYRTKYNSGTPYVEPPADDDSGC